MELLQQLLAELRLLIEANDKREHLIGLAEELYDEYVEPIDIPGPDRIIDPLVRKAIRPIVGQIYDEIVSRFDDLAAGDIPTAEEVEDAMISATGDPKGWEQIIVIVLPLVQQLIEWIRERRKNKPPTPPVNV